MIRNGKDVIELYPGQSTTVQFLEANGQPWVIPAGVTFEGSLITQLKGKVDTLSPTLVNAATGSVRIALAATPAVKSQYDNLCFFNVKAVHATLGTRNLGQYPLMVRDDFTELANFSTAGGGTGTTGGGTGGTTTQTLVILDQTWQASNGKKYVQTIVDVNGIPTPQLQEVT